MLVLLLRFVSRYILYVLFQLSSTFYRNEIDGTGGQRILPTLSKSPLSLIRQNINTVGPLSFFQDGGNRADKHLRVRLERMVPRRGTGAHPDPLRSNGSKSPCPHPANLRRSRLPPATERSSVSLTAGCSYSPGLGSSGRQ